MMLGAMRECPRKTILQDAGNPRMASPISQVLFLQHRTLDWHLRPDHQPCRDVVEGRATPAMRLGWVLTARKETGVALRCRTGNTTDLVLTSPWFTRNILAPAPFVILDTFFQRWSGR